MSTFNRRRKTLKRMAEYAKYRLWRDGDEDGFVSSELAALLWVLAILDELKSRGLYDSVAEAARARRVSLDKIEVKDGRVETPASPRAG